MLDPMVKEENWNKLEENKNHKIVKILIEGNSHTFII